MSCPGVPLGPEASKKTGTGPTSARAWPGEALFPPETTCIYPDLLNDRAERHPLRQLVATAGERGVVDQPSRQRRGERDDGAGGDEAPAAIDHGLDAAVAGREPAYRDAEL